MSGAPAEQNGTSKKDKEDHFTNLYVKCFPQEYTEENICELFGGCGPINAAKVMSDSRGRKFAFVSFERHDDAQNCIKEMHRSDLRTRKERKAASKLEAETGNAPPVVLDSDGHPEHLLYVGRAQSKAERAAMLQSQHGDKGASFKGSPKGKGRGGTVFYGNGIDSTNTNSTVSAAPQNNNAASSAVPSLSSGATAPRIMVGGGAGPNIAATAPSSRDVSQSLMQRQQRQQQHHHQPMPYMNYGYGDGGAHYGGDGVGGIYPMNGSYTANYDSGYGGGGCYSEWGDGYGCEGSYNGVNGYQQQHQPHQQQQQYWAL